MCKLSLSILQILVYNFVLIPFSVTFPSPPQTFVFSMSLTQQGYSFSPSLFIPQLSLICALLFQGTIYMVYMYCEQDHEARSEPVVLQNTDHILIVTI